MTTIEMKNEIDRIKRELNNKRIDDLDIIINKLFEHPIAQNNEHYKFLKEIENDLREYKKNYNY